MSDIAFLLTSKFHSGYLPVILAEHNIKYPVYGPSDGVWTNEELLARARKAIQEGTKVLIATGRTTQLMVKNLPIPVIILKSSVISFARSVSAARKMSKKVGCLLRYGLLYQTALKYKSAFRDKILIAGYEDETDVAAALEYLQSNHIEVIACGGRGGLLAEQYGFHFKCIRVSYESYDVLDSVAEAENILYYTQKNIQYNNMLRTVHNQLDCGILVTDQNGEIMELNDRVLELTGKDYVELQHTRFDTGVLSPLQAAIERESERVLVTINNTLVFAVAQTTQTPDGDTIKVITINNAARRLNDMRNMLNRMYAASSPALFSDLSEGESQSKGYAKAVQTANRFAQVDAPVLLTGPAGSGKDLFARRIHDCGVRADMPFLTVYCGAYTEAELNTFLFGRENIGKPGELELANGGTVFLSEISLLPMKAQRKLLRLIRTREFVNLNEDRIIHLDLRFIASSKNNLSQLVRKGAFSEELYYHISTLHLDVPPLNERREDIPTLLSRILIEKAQEIGCPVPEVTPEAEQYFMKVNYSGNLYQLTNIAQRILVMGGGDSVDLSLARLASEQYLGDSEQDTPLAQEDMDAVLVRETLSACGGKRALAAQRLGISTSTLWRKMKKYGLI